MAGLLIVNPSSGDGGVEELLEAAAERGIGTRVLRSGEDPGEVARRAEPGPLGIAGGDGSLAPVASVALERDLPFVCVPLGTRNHFARDVGLDRDDPVAALAAFTDGEEVRIDVARANGRVFLNNVSLGVYAKLVHRRERHRRQRDAFARLRALAIVASRPEPLGLTLDGAALGSRVVLVSNNHYALDVLSLGERKRLDEGRLHLYAATDLLRAHWDERAAERFLLGASVERLRAAVDGEPVVLEPPVELAIEPRALRVLLPQPELRSGV